MEKSMGKSRFVTVVTGAIIGLLLSFPDDAGAAASDGIKIFAKSIFPSLFPMLILMLLFVNRISLSNSVCVLLGFLSGSPGGTKLAVSQEISQNQARFLCAATGTLSPMFFLSAMPRIPSEYRLLLFFCHIGGALCTAFLFKRGSLRNEKRAVPKPLTFMQAVLQAGKTMLLILSCVILGKVLTALIFCLCPAMPKSISVLLSCLMEIAGGLQALCKMEMQMKTRLIFLSFAAALGGLSLLLQNGALWREKGIPISRLLAMRCIHACLSAFLCSIFV